MKFALKIRKIYTISILASLLAISGLKAQQFSCILNNQVYSLNRYTFPKQFGIEKIYSISQNNLGTLFLSTNKGVILFDGLKWDGVNFYQKAFICACSDTLYLFAKNFTGKIIKESSGSYLVKKITLTLPSKEWDPKQVLSYNNSIVLLEKNGVWLFNGSNFTQLAAAPPNARIYILNEDLYLTTGHETMVWYQGTFVPADNLHFPDSNSQNISCGNTYFSTNQLKQLTRDNNYKNSGEDTISFTFCDWNHNLWLLSGRTLQCLKESKYLEPLSGLDQLYGFESSNGLIRLPDDNNSKSSGLKFTSQFSGQRNAIPATKKIFISAHDGIYILENNKPKRIISRTISFVTKSKDNFLFLSEGSLFSLHYINNSTSVRELANLKTDSVKKILEKKNCDLIILDNQNRISLLKNSEAGYKLENLYDPYSNRETPPIDNIFLIKDDIFASNAFKIYKLKGKELIEQDWIFKNFARRGGFINYLEADSAGNLLFSTTLTGHKREIYFGSKSAKDNYNWYQLPVWEAEFTNPQIISWINDKILLSEKEKLYTFNLKEFFKGKQKIVLSVDEIKVNGLVCSLFYRKKGKKLTPYFEAKHSGDLITIKFQAIDLLNPNNIQYSFFLENGEKDWSPWTSSPERSFFNLTPGDYKIKVKAQTINGNESDIYTIQFKVYPPIFMKWYAWLSYSLMVIGIVGFIGLRRRRQFEKEKIMLEKIIHERTSELVREKEKTDELLANMLPKDTADELKSTGKASSHKFDMVTVLFSDIQGFTKIAEQMNPEKLIDELDNFFFQFDSVVEKYNIEKIKTIGDAYMAAGGIPYKNRTNPVEVVLAALEMQEYMKNLKSKNTDIWDLRIGIHTGAVIAGVVGHKRISYDIWGDTVNTASRMESSGEASKINISGHTYELVKEFFICEYRGKMPVKYKGDIDMYFVKGIRPELSINLRSIPNKKFFVQLQLLRIQDLEEFIFNKLEAELPPKYTFHNLKHTKDVYTQVELLGRAENISPEEMLLVRTAALLHDTGYIYAYQNHETRSLDVCKEILPKYKYSPDQINTISSLILSTKRNTKPTNILEEILIDANTDYLGRIDYISMSLNLYNELKTFNIARSEAEWFAWQTKLIDDHDYYTETARKLREVPQKEQIEKIKNYLKLYV